LELTAFCPSEHEHWSPDSNWKQEIFWVTHGGRCYFLAEYDPAVEKLVGYYVSPYPGRGPITVFDPSATRYPAPKGSGLFDSAEKTIDTMSRWGESIRIGMENDPKCAATNGPFFDKRQLLESCFIPAWESVDGWNNDLLFWSKDGHYTVVSFGSDTEPDQPYRTMDNLPLEIEEHGELHDPKHDIVLVDGAFVSLPAGMVPPGDN
jgi:hypothetical protein